MKCFFFGLFLFVVGFVVGGVGVTHCPAIQKCPVFHHGHCGKVCPCDNKKVCHHKHKHHKAVVRHAKCVCDNCKCCPACLGKVKCACDNCKCCPACSGHHKYLPKTIIPKTLPLTPIVPMQPAKDCCDKTAGCCDKNK